MKSLQMTEFKIVNLSVSKINVIKCILAKNKIAISIEMSLLDMDGGVNGYAKFSVSVKQSS